MKTTILYLPLEADVEIKITLQARFFNGISSDPGTLTREPSLTEIYAVGRALLDGPQLLQKTTLDYPDRQMNDTKNRDKAADGGLRTTDLFSGPMRSALVLAARYTHTRNTGGTLAVVRVLEQCWHLLDDYTREQILRESQEAEYNSDDWQRLMAFAEKSPENAIDDESPPR